MRAAGGVAQRIERIRSQILEVALSEPRAASARGDVPERFVILVPLARCSAPEQPSAPRHDARPIRVENLGQLRPGRRSSEWAIQDSNLGPLPYQRSALTD